MAAMYTRARRTNHVIKLPIFAPDVVAAVRRGKVKVVRSTVKDEMALAGDLAGSLVVGDLVGLDFVIAIVDVDIAAQVIDVPNFFLLVGEDRNFFVWHRLRRTQLAG